MKETINFDLNVKPIMTVKEIKELLPHRSPLLLVDTILELTEDSVLGVKNVTDNEFYFTGHFPNNPIMPGVLQVEAMAQTGGILILSMFDNPQEMVPLFLKIDNVKFRGQVIPGDCLVMKLDLLAPMKRNIATMQGRGYVRNKLVVEAEMTCMITKKN